MHRKLLIGTVAIVFGTVFTVLPRAGFANEFAELQSQQAQHAGDISFDMQYARSALANNHPDIAIFALERILAQQPDNLEAKALMAQAYFMAGETLNAERDFKALQQETLSPETAAQVDQFLAIIDRKKDSAKTGISGYVEVTGGYDSNVNSATSDSSIFIPAFGFLGLGAIAGGTEESDGFGKLSAGLALRHPTSPRVNLLADFGVNERLNLSESDFNQGDISASFGASTRISKKSDIAVIAQGQTYLVDHEAYRNALGLTGQWRYSISESNQLTSFAQVQNLDYPDQSVRNAVRFVAGSTLGHAYGDSRNSLAFGGLYLGTEQESRSGVSHLGHHLVGARLGGQMNILPDMTGFATAAYEYRDYGGTEPLFLVGRKDHQYSVDVGTQYALSDSLSLSPRLGYARTDSNVAVNEYDRFTASVSLRWTFD